MLGRAASRVDPARLLLVHCGELPGVRPGATRLILDVRERTQGGSEHELLADGGGELELANDFMAAAVWPRAHLGKDFSEACLARGALALAEGGELLCAVRKQKGGKSLGRTMKALLGADQVTVEARDRGYHLWVGHRGAAFDEALARELCGLEYEIRDPALGELILHSRPGVFSRRELDGGTRALLEVTAALAEQRDNGPRRVLDLCAGIGPLGLWAAKRWPRTKVLTVDSNLRACALTRQNAAANDLQSRVTVLEHDAMPDPKTIDDDLATRACKPFLGTVELALLNPPTHADPETLLRLFDLRQWMAPGGELLLVVNRPGRAVELLKALGAVVDGGERDGYFVLRAVFVD